MKAPRSTGKLHLILYDLSVGGESGILSVAVKCVDIEKNTSSEAALNPTTDAEARKRGERTGLDTLVVHAVNDGHWV